MLGWVGSNLAFLVSTIVLTYMIEMMDYIKSVVY